VVYVLRFDCTFFINVPATTFWKQLNKPLINSKSNNIFITLWIVTNICMRLKKKPDLDSTDARQKNKVAVVFRVVIDQNLADKLKFRFDKIVTET
jgi:hypothetical protein